MHSDRVEVRAKRVIVAVPPMLTGKIDYEPGPARRARRADRPLPAGHPDEGGGRVPRPFWRDDGLTGQVLYDERADRGQLRRFAADGGKGVVFGFIGGDQARTFAKLKPKQRRAR